jgi:hypothetical protein
LLYFFALTLWATVLIFFIFGNGKNYGERFFAFFTIELICGHHTPPFVRVTSIKFPVLGFFDSLSVCELFEGLYKPVEVPD